VQVRVLRRQPLALILGPDHERVHRSADPRLGLPAARRPPGEAGGAGGAGGGGGAGGAGGGGGGGGGGGLVLGLGLLSGGVSPAAGLLAPQQGGLHGAPGLQSRVLVAGVARIGTTTHLGPGPPEGPPGHAASARRTPSTETLFRRPLPQVVMKRR